MAAQAADAAGGDRPGAGRDGGRGRRSAATSASAPSSPRWSAASSSRSAPTSPTTTRTPGAAPTRPTAWARCGSPRPGWSRRGACWSRPGSPSAVAVAAGIYLATVAGVVILIVGAASILAGVLYTGGPRPYGYEGLGELFVFLFFGLVAVNGSYYVQLERLDWLPLRPLARGRLPGDRDPGRQQRPRPRHRPASRKADPGGAAGPAANPQPLRAAGRGRLRRGAGRAAGRRRAGLGPADRCSRRRSSAGPLGAVMTRTDGPVAERRPGRHRRPARAPSASCSRPGC